MVAHGDGGESGGTPTRGPTADGAANMGLDDLGARAAPAPVPCLSGRAREGGRRPGAGDRPAGRARGDHRRDRGGRTARPGRRRVPDPRQVAHRARQRSVRACRPRSSSTPPRASRARSRTARSSGATPTQVIEGALIAARAVGADRVVFGVKRSLRRRWSTRLRGGHRRGGGGRLGRRRRARRLRGTRRVPLRRGDGAARDHRRPLPVPPHRAAVPARGRRGRRADGRRRAPERAVAPTSRWPGRPASRGAADARRQRRDAGQRAPRSSPAVRAWFRDERHRRVTGHDRVHRHRAAARQRGRPSS